MTNRTPRPRRRPRRNPPMERMMSVDDIASMWQFHPNTIRAWASRGELQFWRHGPGGKMFFRESDVREYLKRWYDL